MASKSFDQYWSECRQLGLLRSKLVANDGLNEEELSVAIKEKREARDDKLMTLRVGNELLGYSCADEIITDSHRRRIRRRANGNENNGRRMEIRYPRADFPERSITSARGSHSLPSSLRKNYLHGGSILEHFDPKALRVIREMTPGSLYGCKCKKVKSEIHPRRLALDVSVAPAQTVSARRAPQFPKTTFVPSAHKHARRPRIAQTTDAKRTSHCSSRDENSHTPAPTELLTQAVEAFASSGLRCGKKIPFGEVRPNYELCRNAAAQDLANERAHRPLIQLPFCECAPPAPCSFRSGSI